MTEADLDCTCAGCIFLSNAAYAQATLLWAFSTILLYKFYRCPEFGRLHCCQRYLQMALMHLLQAFHCAKWPSVIP